MQASTMAIYDTLCDVARAVLPDPRSLRAVGRLYDPDESNYGEFLRGQVRQDEATLRLVKLIDGLFLDDDVDREPEWIVEDLLSGKIYIRLEIDLGPRVWTPLEVLAWAAEDHPDVEISGD